MGASFTNVEAYYGQNQPIASLGNIDGSGRNFFAIGSPGAIYPNTTNNISDGAGAVYVLPSQSNWSNITLPTGNNSGWSNLTSLTSAGGFVIYSSKFASIANNTLTNASDLGFSVSSAGDVNGDGIADFLIGAPMANGGQGAVFLVFGVAGGLPQTSPGVVDLDQLVSKGASQPFGTPGTAVEYVGDQSGQDQWDVGSSLGTSVAGGDTNGSGISSYSMGAWGENTGSANNGGAVYTYNGTTAFLTQGYSTANGAVYYAGDQGVGYTNSLVANGNHIATGQGNNDWVHGIGLNAGDSVDGGAGSDFVGIVGTNFMSLNGGNGWNTLVFEHSGLTLNLTAMGLKVQGFAAFDLSNQLNNPATDPSGKFTGATTGNMLELRLADVLQESNGNVGLSTQHMTIMGDASSVVQLLTADGAITTNASQAGWAISNTTTVNGVNYDVWHNSAANGTVADLLIEHGVTVI
jgi:hypothetical protein